MKRFMAAAAICVVGSSAQAGCGSDEAVCEIEGGSYHAVVPDGTPKGALVFLHGWGSSGQGSMRMTGMVNRFVDAGYVVIAADGTPREGRSGRGWSFHPDWPAARDEIEFLARVKADGATRFGYDSDNVLLSGFSIGGSMTSYVACFAPDTFAAYAPVAGGMWRPHPQSCEGPVKLLHTHGWNDGTVPLEGRAVRGTNARDPNAVVQGDVFSTLDTWRVANDCVNHMPDRRRSDGAFWTRTWTKCAPDSALSFAMFPGGHAMPRGWATMALEWFEGGDALN
ncbi:MAG: prolyl oligopeptidase family serine peptidase [Aliishimia sp.]